MNAVDLFAGPGGWDVAARELGIDALGIEIDHAACLTRRAAGHRTLEGPVAWWDPRDYLGIDGLIASPPCTDFSVAGLRRGIEGPTGALVAVPMRWAEVIRPQWIAWEQVPPVLPIWQEYALALQGLGYWTWTGLLHSEQYGVPQTRKRAVLMAHRDLRPEAPKPTHSRYYPRDPKRLDGGVLPWVSMAEALGWGMTARPVPTISSRSDDGGPRIDGGSGARPALRSAQDDGDWVYMGAGAGHHDGQQPRPAADPAHTITGKGTAAWVAERPSPTVVGSFRPDVVAAPGWRTAGSGPRQNAPGSVRVTVQEAGVLQSFPADYPWRGTSSKRYQQVGNAIPPRLARAVLAALTDQHFSDQAQEARHTDRDPAKE